MALTLTVESMVLISLISLDVLLFYVFFEAMLIPMYFLIGGFGHGAGRSRAAVKFLLYNLFGGLIMLAAVIGVYVVTAQHIGGTFDFRTIVAAVSSGRLGVDPAVLKALFLGSCSRSPSRHRCGRFTVGCPTPRSRRHRPLQC
ncbi:NADH-Ubiquinone/plastoquinone (complex I), various chains family protein [Mycobacterium xenopi 4042]|uniref:NADH-Ubiquinone/plastoquinone (Complex I), various chains family protein n=1 Tax=Mycobacterium xenopi 4042 TaxID=1299334 RepID=X7Z4Z3_MYCXE|nr:NADH-Ubiquinone/plastoquinone (complex I), various chains family protein [Mycobacterium xenopi 4042]